MKPPFSYYGGKVRLAPWIVSLLPDHRVYVEPCLGGGAVFFAKSPTEHEILNDIDGALVAFFRTLRDHPDDLIRQCEATPYARVELNRSDPDEAGIDDLERARRQVGANGLPQRDGRDEDHRVLAAGLTAARGTVLISGYDNSLYAELFAGWHMTTRDTIKRASNGQNDHCEPVTEIIWSNRPLNEGRLTFTSS